MRTRPAPIVNRPVNARSVEFGREFSVKFDRNRPLGGQRRTLPVERLEVGKAQVMRLDGQGSGVPLRSLR